MARAGKPGVTLSFGRQVRWGGGQYVATATITSRPTRGFKRPRPWHAPRSTLVEWRNLSSRAASLARELRAARNDGRARSMTVPPQGRPVFARNFLSTRTTGCSSRRCSAACRSNSNRRRRRRGGSSSRAARASAEAMASAREQRPGTPTTPPRRSVRSWQHPPEQRAYGAGSAGGKPLRGHRRAHRRVG
jgi:hypothetical protein